MADIAEVTQDLPPTAAASRSEEPNTVPRMAKSPSRSGRERRQVCPASQQRLVVVSNRVPVPKDGLNKAGGLTVALEGALKQSGGLWFGWSGSIVGGGSETPEGVGAGEKHIAGGGSFP